jgi:hypothetical protein
VEEFRRFPGRSQEGWGDADFLNVILSKFQLKRMFFEQKQNIFNRSFKSPFFQKMVISHRSTRRK